MQNLTSQSSSNQLSVDPIGGLFAVLLMRLWLGFRSLQAGIEKYAGIKTTHAPAIIDGKPDPNGTTIEVYTKVYSIEHYKGVPSALGDKFLKEPFINEKLLSFYDDCLGPLLIILGLTLILGIATRISLLCLGCLFTSLTFGLILLNQPSGIAWLAAHIILIAMMLLFSNHNRFELGNYIGRFQKLALLSNK